MPDLYQFDAVTIGESVTQPPLADLARRARRRRTRRHLATATVGAGLAVAAILTVPALTSRPAAPDQGFGATPLPTKSTPPPNQPVYRADVGAVEFLDHDHGVGTRLGNCAIGFRVTADGGRTWSSLRGPKPWRECEGNAPRSTPRDYDHMILDADTIATKADGAWQLSRDAGQTWHPWNPQVTQVDALPTGLPLLDRCPVSCAKPTVLDLATGNLISLRYPPPGGVYEVIEAAGTLWAKGEGGPDIQHPTVWRSTDRGRTWSHTTLDLPFLNFGLAPRNATEAYAISAINGFAVLHTTDGGTTWQQVPVAVPPNLDGGSADPAFVSAGGALVIGTQRAVYASTDGGQHFTPIAGNRETGAGPLSRGHVIVRPDFVEAKAYLSIDGSDWQQVPLPTR